MSSKTYQIESLDLAAYLVRRGYRFLRSKKVANKRHVWILEDHDGKAHQTSFEFPGSDEAEFSDIRKRLISVTRCHESND